MGFFGTALATRAQNVLFVDTAMTTGSSQGFALSNVATSTTTIGSSAFLEFGYMIAEDFTIPAGEKWTISDVTAFAYQTQPTAPYNTNNTITKAYLMIFNGQPGAAGTTLLYGDTTTNRFAGATFTNVQRQTSDTAVSGRNRPVMAVKMALPAPIQLSAGTYWAAYSMRGASNLAVYSAPKVLPNKTNPNNQNGRQLTPTGWIQMADNGFNLGYNLMVNGTVQTDVNDIKAADLALRHAPNPAHGAATISFHLQKAAQVHITLYDATGKLVQTLAHEQMQVGDRTVPCNLSALPAGQYFYKLDADGLSVTRPLQVF